MDEHERGFYEGYQSALNVVMLMLNGGMPIAMIKEEIQAELSAEDDD